MYRGMPEVYQLVTNDDIFLISGHPTISQMMEYQVRKIKEGMKPTDIIFKVIPYKLPTAKDVLNLTGIGAEIPLSR